MKKIVPFEDIQLLHRLFRVCPDGVLLRIVDLPRQRPMAGNVAGTVGAYGRLHVKVNGRHIYVHSIVWAMTHGAWPTSQVDHINGNPLDNRPSNLRLANTAQNQFNTPLRPNSSSGLKGVHFHKQSGMWRVQVCAFRVRHVVGKFITKEVAYDFACLLRSHLHGEFAHD